MNEQFDNDRLDRRAERFLNLFRRDFFYVRSANFERKFDQTVTVSSYYERVSNEKVSSQRGKKSIFR